MFSKLQFDLYQNKFVHFYYNCSFSCRNKHLYSIFLVVCRGGGTNLIKATFLQTSIHIKDWDKMSVTT